LYRIIFDKYGEVVKKPSDADVIVTRISRPWEKRKGGSLLENFFSAGRLSYSEEELFDCEVGLIDFL